MTLAALACMLIAAAPAVRGVVRSSLDGRPVQGVVVRTAAGATPVVTDSTGAYTLVLPASGNWELRFDRAGFRGLRVGLVVDEGSDAQLDVALDPVPERLPPVVATGSDASPTGELFDLGEAEVGVYHLRGDDRAGLRLRDPDLLRTLATLPASESRADGAPDLHVRGGGGDQNLLLVNGFPVYGASHFGPASSAINPDAIADLVVHAGAPPVRFGERLSSVVELTTADADSNGARASGSVSAADARGMLAWSGAGAHAGVMMSARASYRGLLGDGAGGEDRNGYSDLLVTGHAAVLGGTVRALDFRSNNSLSFVSQLGTGLHPVESSSPTALGWAAQTDGVGWRRMIGERVSTDVRLWSARAQLDGRWNAPEGVSQVASGFNELGAAAEAHVTVAGAAVDFGGQIARLRSRYGVDRASAGAPLHFTENGTRWIPEQFVAASYDFGAGVRATAGTRIAEISGAGVLLSPEMTLRWRLRPVSLGISAGRRRQFAQSAWNEESLGAALLGLEVPLVPGSHGEGIARSDDIQLEAEATLVRGVTARAGLFHRSLSGLRLPAVRSRGLTADTATAFGTGTARGAFAALRVQASRVTLAATTSITDVRRRADGIAYSPAFSHPVALELAATVRPVPFGVAWAAFAVGSGQVASAGAGPVEWSPYAGITGTGELSGTLAGAGIRALRDTLPIAMSLDIGLQYDWVVGGAGRHPAVLSASLAVRNLLNRHNVIAFLHPGAGAAIPVLARPRALFGEIAWHF